MAIALLEPGSLHELQAAVEAKAKCAGEEDQRSVGASAQGRFELSCEKSQNIIWYSPKIELWRMLDFWIYPSLAAAEDGVRTLDVTIVVKDPSRGRPAELQVDNGEETWVVPITDSDKIKIRDSGCRVTQTIYLRNQAPLVQKLAEATQARISVVGYRRPVHYTMTAEDLEHFRLIATLWNSPVLPPMPSQSIQQSPAGPVIAGKDGVTNPVLIPSSRVPPRFPALAQFKKVYGRVVLEAVIHKDGTVGEIKVEQGAGGDCGFEESAIEAVSRWRYHPATKDGQPVDACFTVIVDFAYDR